MAKKNILARLAGVFLAASVAVPTDPSADRVPERIVGTPLPPLPPPPSAPNASASNATKAVLVDLTVVIDRSGSMYSMGGAPLKALNVFIEEQQGAAIADNRLNTTSLRIVTFDDRVELAYDGPLASASIDAEAVSPRGSTRLLDTAAEELIAQRMRVKALRAQGRNATELFALLTDGQDNASEEFCTESFHALVEDARDRGVLCLFLAANMDAVTAGQNFGFARSHSMTLDADEASMMRASATMSRRSAHTMSEMWTRATLSVDDGDWDRVSDSAEHFAYSAQERASASPRTSRKGEY